MRRNRKRKRKIKKRVTWESSLETLVEDEESIPSPKRVKKDPKSSNLGKAYRQLIQSIDEHLKASPPKLEAVITRLTDELVDKRIVQANKGQFLFYFMQNNNFTLFNWALENKKPELIRFILGNLSNRFAFLCVCYNNSSSFRKFCQSAFESGKKFGRFGQDEAEIFKIISEIRQKDVVKGVMIEVLDTLIGIAPAIKNKFLSYLSSGQAIKNKLSGIEGKRPQTRLFVVSKQNEDLSKKNLGENESATILSR